MRTIDSALPSGLLRASAKPRLAIEELEAALADIRASPLDDGVLAQITRRPRTGEREVLDHAQLDETAGLVGDNWASRISSKTGLPPTPDTMLTLMNVRVAQLVGGDAWALAGDNLYVDMLLSRDNLAVGARLAIGDAIVCVTEPPHTGCAKFSARFGSDVMKWVNTAEGRALNLRGVHARVVQTGAVRRGDRVRKVAS
jgi:MOSC domain